MGQALQVPATVFCLLGGRRSVLFSVVSTLKMNQGSLPSKAGSYKR